MHRAIAIALTLAAAAGARAGVLNEVVVSNGNMNGWLASATGTSGTDLEYGPATPPMGTGSAGLTTGADGGSSGNFRTQNHAGLPLATITQLTYATYSNKAGLAPYMQLRLDYNGDSTTDDILHFEPEYQLGYTANVPAQADLVVGQWQTWDALAGGWWSVFNTLGTGNAGANVLPLSAFIAANPAARLTPGTTSLRVLVGFGAPTWNNFDGNFDAVGIGTALGGVVYNFEVPAPGAAGLLGVGGLALLRRRR